MFGLNFDQSERFSRFRSSKLPLPLILRIGLNCSRGCLTLYAT